MDMITHAIVGAATGATLGHPIAGAVAAVAPDLVLGIKRKEKPTTLYKFTHTPIAPSFIMFGALNGLAQDAKFAAAMVLCYLTHVVLDAFTHGDEWAPKLFSPFSERKINIWGEWEWFNRSWWGGFLLSVGWVYLCLIIITRS